MFSDINSVTLVGRLTRDPEVRYTSGGMQIVSIGIAVNGRRKNSAGSWEDKPNFFDLKMFGDRGERAAAHLQKGTRIAVDGRLEWDSWETDGQKRSKVEVIVNEIQILDGRNESGGANRQGFAGQGGDVAPDTSDFVPVGAATADDDDIPF